MIILLIMASSVINTFSSPTLRGYKPGGQYICLTFEDGPDAELTPKLLDILLSKQVKATFFVLGSKCHQHPEILSRIVKEGHEIASHSWSHENNFLNTSMEVVHEDLRRTAKIIEKTTGTLPRFVRPPDGNTTPAINKDIKEIHNISYVVNWNLNSNDIQKPYPSRKVKNVVNRAKPGDIVLFHDVFRKTIELMPVILDGLIEKGFECLTITQMLSYPDDSPHRRR